jgi:hypothetical protein
MAAVGMARSIFSQGTGNLSTGDKITLGFKMFENASETSDLFEYDAYIIRKPVGSAVGDFSFDQKSNAVSNIAHFERDLLYVNDSSLATDYYADLTINTTLAAEEWYVVIAGDTTDNDNTNGHEGSGSTNFNSSTSLFSCSSAGGCTDVTFSMEAALEITKQDSAQRKDYSLTEGTYYFHIRAKDNAGNWGDPTHYKIDIDTEGAGVEITSPFTGQLFSTPNITVDVSTTASANVTVYTIYANGSGYNSTSSMVVSDGEFNVTLAQGMNEIYAQAEDVTNGVVTRSGSVYVRYGTQLGEADKTLTVRNADASTVGLSSMVYGTSSGKTVGMASESPSISTGVGQVTADTSQSSIKIFFTNPLGASAASDRNDEIADDEFLDKEIPMFGFDKKASDEFIISAEVRYPTAYFAGDRKVNTGKYSLIIKNEGYTADGKVNLTVHII